MGYRRFSILPGHSNFENTKLVFCHWCCISVPVVEVADEVGSEGIGSPFAVDHIAVIVDDESEFFITLPFSGLALCQQL